MWMPGSYGNWTAAPVNFVGVGNHIGWTPRPLSTAVAATTATPVIVSSKTIGKEGKNRVMSASMLEGKLTPNVEPSENGKTVVAAGTFSRTSARLVVPTSANLGALQAGLGGNARVALAPKIAASPAHLAAPSNEFSFRNAGPVPSRVPSRPAPRAEFSEGIGAPGYSPTAGRTSASTATATPAQTSHASTTASSGRPR
jgi:hypothetical protein